jgi:SAM-dependent methyltransferase
MSVPVSPAVWEALACPQCRAPLGPSETGACCQGCGREYGRAEWGALDLRLPQEKKYPVSFAVGPASAPAADVPFLPLPAHPAQEVDFTGVPRPHNLSHEFLSYFPRARARPALLLDLGCGDSIHRPITEHAGYEWVGVDHAAREALLLADAHSLPFRDQAFECVLTVAVFEHLRFPFVAIQEIHRVLKPGGKLLGTVAFLEPFHGDSYYHHSPLGTLNTLRHGGFTVQYVAPHVHWTGLLALARMGLFPGMPLPLVAALVAPLRWLHVLWWTMAGWLGLASPEKRLRNTTAAFAFVATR